MKVIIIGAGFGGLTLARKLNNRPGFEVVLIDRYNYHQFQPLFYQVATAALDPSNISFPLRKIFQKSKNVRIKLDELKKVLPGENKIVTIREEISYDVLVLATGASTNFFGNTTIADNALPMKSTLEALQLRYRLLQNLELATTVSGIEELQSLMNIVVVGAGPTGVELSGALAEMKNHILPKEYPELDFASMNIYLLEGGSQTLSSMSERSSFQSQNYLERLGVKLMTHTTVKDYNGKQVFLSDGTIIPARTVIWAAGIKGNIPSGIDPELIAAGNRIKTDRQCRVENSDNIYAIGDLAYMETPKFPNSHPQVAPVAMQHALLLAQNLVKLERRSTLFYDFEYNDKGSMATIGRNLAVVDIPRPKLHLGGFIAWLAWMGFHLLSLLGVKNRFIVLINWVYHYITYDQSLRLIFRDLHKSIPLQQLDPELAGTKIHGSTKAA